ncbi:WecB/TagA/CpsF family glycosyltransferase [Fibrella arboris]|uniref:WecB/TagA/CpsF family glycosyltransferase n=1 Tax=Fibrella arboris TaxID=3242486 RepID=UPI0035230932
MTLPNSTFSGLPADPRSYQRAQVLDLSVTLGTYRQVQESMVAAAQRGESRTACFANVHMTVEAAGNKAFANMVNGADWVAADGVPLTWALSWLYSIQQERIAGIDMLPDLIQRAAQEQIPVFFYGSTANILEKAVAVCRERHPGILIAGTLSPPFRELTPEEDEQMIITINRSGARIVFVALGCPKQERWMAQMRGRIHAVMLGIGGALPILAGAQSRSPNWMQRNGLEWVYRLAKEPRRLFKRYAVTNTLFILRLIQHRIKNN